MRRLEKLFQVANLALVAGPSRFGCRSASGEAMLVSAALGALPTGGRAFSAKATSKPAVEASSNPQSDALFALVGCTMEDLEAKFKMRKGGGNLMGNVEMLLQKGVPRGDLPRVVKAKSIQYLAGLKTETLNKKLDSLVELMELEPNELSFIVRMYPTVMGLSWENNVEVFLNELLVRHSKQKIKKAILKFPALLGFAKKFDTLAGIMHTMLGCSREEFLGIVVRFPSILGYSIEKNTKPKVQQLLDIGLTKDDAKVVVTTAPSFFGRDFEKVVDEKLTWLKEELWMSDRDGLDVLSKSPEVFLANTTLWQESLNFFIKLGWSREAMTEFFKADPVVLAHRVELLDEKLKFARKHLKKTDEELLACPSYFSASFSKVILFRTAFWQEFGEHPHNVPLTSLLGGPNSEFNKRFDAEEIKNFGKDFNKLSQDERLKSIISRL